MTRTKPGVLEYHRPDGTTEQISLQQDVVTLGRSDSCAIVIGLPTVSRLHATIATRYERYVIADAGSANGTFVNGQRIMAEHQLSTDDEIWLGSSEAALLFSDPEQTLLADVGSPALPLLIDTSARTVRVYGNGVALSPLEYGLLLHLARHPGTVCTRESCFLAVWNQPYDPATCEDALNACMTKLRRNLRAAAHGAGQEPPQITTLLRAGFRLDTPVVLMTRPLDGLAVSAPPETTPMKGAPEVSDNA